MRRRWVSSSPPDQSILRWIKLPTLTSAHIVAVVCVQWVNHGCCFVAHLYLNDFKHTEHSPESVCKSKRIVERCFCTGSGHPALPACHAAAARPAAGRREACRIPEGGCGCRGARRRPARPAHTAGGGPGSRCPSPAESGPGCTEDLRHPHHTKIGDGLQRLSRDLSSGHR